MKKKLWLLRPSDNNKELWEPWYDKVFGFIVRAETEQEARKLASQRRGDEGKQAWLDNKLSSCVELMLDGETGIIMIDFFAA